MSRSHRFSSFLSLHPRLLQLVTVTPLSSSSNEKCPFNSGHHAHEEPGDDKTTDTEGNSLHESLTRLSSERELDEAFLTEVILIVQRYSNRDGASKMRRRSTGRDAEAVEAIRALAQIVVWGDQNNPSLWDVFMNGQVMFHLSEILKHTTSPAVRRQCLQSISIMVQSFRNDTSLYNLFSRNHINEILTFKADRDDLELIGHLISLIRGITNRINDDLLQFFFDEDAQSFPLYEKATELFDHKEAMFRIAIRNATLSIFNLEDERVLEYATKDLNSESHYFNRLFFYVRSIEDMVERAFSRCAQADLPDATLHSIDNQMCELESILDYVNEAIANNERTIGAYLGGAAIREFVQPPLIEMASLAGSDRAQLGKFERRAGIFGWHVALCLVLLKHKLIGRAMTAEMLSSFSHNGQTPSQCLKDLVMLSIDERAVHMALCAVEALVSYPLCEYDDLINAGFALASRSSTKSTECCPGDCPDANGTGHSPRSPALDDSGEINLSSSLSGYDFVTGNQLPKSDLDEDSITDDEVNSLGATFIDLVSSVFRMERPTRSLRVVQACARLVLAVAHAGGEVIGRSCAAIAAILLSEYLCAIRSVIEEDPEVAISMHEALLASFKAKASRRPPKLEDQLCQCDIVTNKGFYLPPSPQMAGALKLEGMRRKRLRHGISVQRSSRKLSKLEEVKKRFIRFDADTLCVLAWLTAELAEQHDALAQLEERMKEAVDAPSPLKPMTAKTSVERILDAFAGLCTAKRERGDVPDDDAKKPAHQVTGSGKT